MPKTSFSFFFKIINPIFLKKCIIFLSLFFFLPFLCKAQQAIEDSLNKVVADYKDEAEVARAYNALGYEYTRKDVAKARSYFGNAIIIGKKIKNFKRLSSSYSALVYLLHDAGKPDSAEYFISLVKNLVEQAGSESEKIALNSNYYTVAALYYRKTGANQKAIPFLEKAIELLIKMGDKESTAGQTLNLGNAYVDLGNFQKGTEMHLKALRIFEEVGSQRGMSFCYQSLSTSFTQLKQYKQALIYANKSLKIKTTINDRRGLGTAQSGLGNIYFGLKDFDKALYHFTAALNIAREQKILPDEQENYLNIAKVYKAKSDSRQAIEYFNQSKLLAKQLRDTSSVAAIDAELIALQYNTQKITASENKLKTSIELFQEQGDLNRQASGFKNMVDFYTGNKEFEKALEYNNKYHQAVDSLQNNQLQLQVKKMEEQYTVEKKEKEITLLKKDKELQQQKLFRQRALFAGAALLLLLSLIGIWLLINRNKLKERMKELELRNQIAADLHDEVGSSLSSIHMLSQMATQHGNDATHKDILTRMSGNAKETMDKMGDIVWMIKPGENDSASLKERMERFTYEICGSKNISVSLQLDELSIRPGGEKLKLSMEQRKNIYLIFKEAVNNSVKYSGTEKIEVKASLKNKELVLQVKDFGKGFDRGLVKKGNGLDNMQHRAKELKGFIAIDTSINGGAALMLCVPL
jgi:two-component system, NarL family, sensor histidine kinase UhpB